MLIRSWARLHLLRITASVGLATFVLCVVMTTKNYNSPRMLVFSNPGRPQCPSMKKLTARDIYGLELDMKGALSCRFEERRKRLKNACAKTGIHHYISNKGKKHSVSERTLFFRTNNTMCVLQKIGSQFWRHFFNIYQKSVLYDEIKSIPYDTLQQQHPLKTLTIAFVRDPYSRLFSGFVDKLFSANPTFWKMGRRVIQTVRFNGRQQKSQNQCGIDTTFAEFVEYLLIRYQNKTIIDPHFKPIQFRCGFCKVEYDYIGKMETFLEDMLFVSEAVGALKYNLTREYILDQGFGGARKSMYRNAHNLFGSRLKGVIKCGVSLRQAVKLTWRRWQIRGFIEPKFDVPFKKNEKNVTFERFYEAALVAHTSSDHRKLAEAKKAALREAYSSLSSRTRLRLQEMFLPQFEMFGYEAMPDVVFGHHNITKFGFSFLETQTIFDNK